MISSDPPRAINPEGEKSAIEKRYSFYDQIFYDTDELRAWIKSTRVASKPHLTKTCIVTDQDWPSPFVAREKIEEFTKEMYKSRSMSTFDSADEGGGCKYKLGRIVFI